MLHASRVEVSLMSRGGSSRERVRELLLVPACRERAADRARVRSVCVHRARPPPSPLPRYRSIGCALVLWCASGALPGAGGA